VVVTIDVSTVVGTERTKVIVGVGHSGESHTAEADMILNVSKETDTTRTTIAERNETQDVEIGVAHSTDEEAIQDRGKENGEEEKFKQNAFGVQEVIKCWQT